MPITLIQTQTSLNDVIAKRFTNLAPADLKRVQEATLKINPNLQGFEPIRPGQVVVLPDLPDLNPVVPPTSRPSASREFAASDAVRAVSEALADSTPLIQRALDAARAGIEATAKLAGSDAVKRMIEQNPSAGEFAKALDASLASETSTLDDTRKKFSAGVSVLQQDLETLMKRLG